ncbi:MAG: biopolymer transporter ExbD [Phycisphaerae bacterium]|nr:biopolymer transporter ExbD [Phycisphaerae bacterium]
MSTRRTPGGGFRRRDAGHVWSLHFGPNMTPMVDVVLVILIFFMAGTAFVGKEWFLRSAIPVRSGAASAKPADPYEIPYTNIEARMTLDPGGRTVVTGLDLKDAPLESFLNRLREFASGTQASKITVIAFPAPNIPYRDVVRLHEVCHSIGITRTGVSSSSRP